MTATTPQSATGWARFLGITLRPWSGHSPFSLLLRGGIQTAIAVGLAYLAMTMDRDEVALDPAVRSILVPVLLIAIITVGYLLLTGVSSLVVGVLDFGPRKTFTGQVVSDRERKLGDFLPLFVQRMIWNRGSGIDKRKTRWEVVLRTDTGEQAFTVRKFATRRLLQSGAYVTVQATPVAHYIDKVQTHQQ